MEFLKIENLDSKEIYLNFLEDLICLLKDYKETLKGREEEYDEL